MKKNFIVFLLLSFTFMFGFNMNVKAATCDINHGYIYRDGNCVSINDLEKECREHNGYWDSNEKVCTHQGEISMGCKDQDIKNLLSVIKKIYNLIRIATPIILVIMGSIDFLKAVISQKEDDIVKNRKKFITRIFLAILVFMVLSIFELVTSILGVSNINDSDSWINCWRSL